MGSRHRAFTLVELLVVVGIIALLISLLFPLLGRAMESARRIDCMNNLRHLTHTIILYGNDNRGSFPGAAGGWSINGDDPLFASDWIYWQSFRNIENSRLARYLEQPLKPAAFRCPSDDWRIRPQPRSSGPGTDVPYERYFYSYCMNKWLDSIGGRLAPAHYMGKMNLVRDPSRMIVLAEVDERELRSGGAWEPTVMDRDGSVKWAQLLSVRHDRRERTEVFSRGYNPDRSFPDARGNVGFVDGHVDYVTRRVAHDPASFAPPGIVAMFASKT
jgi:prepilin-type N-terminal cleavage/methylation domain-containing protein/prepilin-type processing-associated H-X9-DG protein